MGLFKKMVNDATNQLVTGLIIVPIVFVVLACVAMVVMFNV